jgi:hypothetical protein
VSTPIAAVGSRNITFGLWRPYTAALQKLFKVFPQPVALLALQLPAVDIRAKPIQAAAQQGFGLLSAVVCHLFLLLAGVA